ncbi:hypothetical protein Btru_043492 [Bulinus truncatus]|nr:hypothetical protein Btru_043492 [Bulinus truncatus]
MFHAHRRIETELPVSVISAHGQQHRPDFSSHEQHKRCRLTCPSGQVLDRTRCQCLLSLLNVIKLQCSPPVCPRNCDYGLLITNNPGGCKSCRCADPPRGRCAPVACRMFCPNGWAKDGDGCDTCRCRDQPAPPVSGRNCGPVCRIYCPFGHVQDSHGCPTCKCNSPPSAAGS